MVAGGKKVSGCEIKIWLDYAICGGEKGFECFIPKCFGEEKTHLKRGGWDSCWVWVSVSMSSRRHGRVLDKSHVIPSSEQLKEFYFHHLEFWSWQQCAELGIKCQFSEKSSEMCHARALHQCPPGWHDVVKPVCVTLDSSAAIIWIFGQQRRYHWAILRYYHPVRETQVTPPPTLMTHGAANTPSWESVTLIARIMRG